MCFRNKQDRKACRKGENWESRPFGIWRAPPRYYQWYDTDEGAHQRLGADSFCSEENEHGSRQICLIAHRDTIAGLTKNAVAGM